MGYFDRWICADCGVELSPYIYMVWDTVWLSVMESDAGHLCLLCLEDRLGRPLDAGCDFTPAPINNRIAAELAEVRQLGREALLQQSRQRRERLDRRAARRRALAHERKSKVHIPEFSTPPRCG